MMFDRELDLASHKVCEEQEHPMKPSNRPPRLAGPEESKHACISPCTWLTGWLPCCQLGSIWTTGHHTHRLQLSQSDFEQHNSMHRKCSRSLSGQRAGLAQPAGARHGTQPARNRCTPALPVGVLYHGTGCWSHSQHRPAQHSGAGAIASECSLRSGSDNTNKGSSFSLGCGLARKSYSWLERKVVDVRRSTSGLALVLFALVILCAPPAVNGSDIQISNSNNTQSYWSSSSQIRIPGFVTNSTNGTYFGPSPVFSVTDLSSQSFLSALPQIEADGTLVVNPLQTRTGGSSDFRVDLTESGMPRGSQYFVFSLFVGYAEILLSVDSKTVNQDQLASLIASQLGVQQSKLSFPNTAVTGNSTSLVLRINALSAAEALSHVEALDDSTGKLASVSTNLSSTVSQSSRIPYFVDIGVTQASVTLANSSLTYRSDVGAVNLQDFFQVLAPQFVIGSDEKPNFLTSATVPRIKQSTASGPLSQFFAANGTAGPLLVGGISVLANNSIEFTVSTGVGGVVEAELSFPNVSLTALFTINIVPISTAPSFDAAVRVIGIENQPLTFNISSIARGGWTLATELNISFSWTAAPGATPLVSVVSFPPSCSEVGISECQISVTLLENKFGVGNITLSVENIGSDFTPYFTDSFTKDITLQIESVNEVPTFSFGVPEGTVRRTLIEEDASCILPRPSGLTVPVCDTSVPLYHEYPDFATAVFMGLYEDLTILGCPPSDTWSAVPGRCLNQTGKFTVEKVAETLANSTGGSLLNGLPQLVIETLPSGVATGRLSFFLTPDASGEATFNVTLTDDGIPPRSSSKLLTVAVEPVNDAPSFTFLNSGIISVVEDSGAFNGSFIASVNSGPGEAGQTVSFTLNVDPGSESMFAAGGAPRLLPGNILSFKLETRQFGTAKIYVTAQDSGGAERGGVDTSAPQLLQVIVSPLNDPPSFEIPNPTLHVVENSGSVSVPSFATSVTAGAPNEDCSTDSDGCENQKISFLIEDILRTYLFADLPTISTSGTLSFELNPGVSGAASFVVRLVDDGGIPKSNTSDLASFDIIVNPAQYQPSFALERRVSCLSVSVVDNDQCACPRHEDHLTSELCALQQGNDISKVEILRDAGNVSITAFVTQITNAEGYVPASVTVFSVSNKTGLAKYQEFRKDPVASSAGMQYATDVALSPDGRFAYAVEFDLDTLLVLQKEEAGSSYEVIDRRETSERRLRFLGFNDADSFDPTPIAQRHSGGKDFALFQEGNRTFIVTAGGMPHLSSDVSRRQAQMEIDAMTQEEEILLWDHTIGYWLFSMKNVFAPVGFNKTLLAARFNLPNESGHPVAQQRTSNFECTEHGCSFSRPLAEFDTDHCYQPDQFLYQCAACLEDYPTYVQNATLRDLKGTGGPLVLTGPACKHSNSTANTLTSDWHSPVNQIDLRTFMMTSMEVDAMQFDDNLNRALYLSYNLDSLLTGDDATSALPVKDMSIELWFTISDTPTGDQVSTRGLLGVESLIDFRELGGTRRYCGKGLSLAYNHSASGTTFILRVFTEEGSLPAARASDNNGKWQLTAETRSIPSGVWQHLVATYDGSDIALYLNGSLLNQQAACDDPPCGNIVYPATIYEGVFPDPPTVAERYLTVTDSTADPTFITCQHMPHNFTVGTFVNSMWHPKYTWTHHGPQVQGHKGAIHSLRIFKVALNVSDIQAELDRKIDTMSRNSVDHEYWTVSHIDGRENPSIDFVDLDRRSDFVVRGHFDFYSDYRCEWSTLPTFDGEEFAFSSAQISIDDDFTGRKLTCSTPVWSWVRLAYFRVAKYNVDGWYPVWLKVCIDVECGYPAAPEQRARWFWGTPVVSRNFVSDVIIQSPGQNYVNGDLQIESEATVKAFRGSFSVDELTGAITETLIDHPGLGYQISNGTMSLLYPGTDKPITNSITNFSMTMAGSGYVDGCWVLHGQVGATNHSGVFTATAWSSIFTLNNGREPANAGVIDTFTTLVQGEGYTSDPTGADVTLYYDCTYNKSQDGTITQVITNRNSTSSLQDDEILLVQRHSVDVGSTTFQVDLVAVCYTSGCTGTGFRGKCLYSNGKLADLVIVDPGSGYKFDAPPHMHCVINGSYANASMTAIVPSRPTFNVQRASGGLVTFQIVPETVNPISATGVANNTLRNTVDAIVPVFRFLTSTYVKEVDFSNSVGAGEVEGIQTQIPGQHYLQGDLRIDSDESGKSFSGSFSVNEEGNITSISITDSGFGYLADSGYVSLYYPGGHRKMTDSITSVYLNSTANAVPNPGSEYVEGCWEIRGGTITARGTFTVLDYDSSIFYGSTTAIPVRGQIKDVSLTQNGGGYTADPSPSDVALYHCATGNLQDGSITRVLSGRSSTSGLSAGVETTQASLLSDSNGDFEVDLIAKCNNTDCNSTITQNFAGKCIYRSNRFAGVTISDHGLGYKPEYPPQMFCVLNGFEVNPSLVPKIPSRAHIYSTRASGAQIIYNVTRRNMQIIGEFGFPKAGIWDKSYNTREIWTVAASTLPFEVDGTKYLLVAGLFDGLLGNRTVFTHRGYNLQADEPSALYQWNSTTSSYSCVQGVPSSGAYKWHYFSMRGANYVAVANYRANVANGSTTTNTWSAIYRFGSGVDPGVQFSTCNSPSSHGANPIDTNSSTQLATAGATAIQTFVMNNTVKARNILYMVVSNYYNDSGVSASSRLYMVGKPVSATQSEFSDQNSTYWPVCSDTLQPCGSVADCQIHKCDRECVVTSRGDFYQKRCQCSQKQEFCLSDSDCNQGLMCSPQNVAIAPEDHSSCYESGLVRQVGKQLENQLTLCEIQTFSIDRVIDVEYAFLAQKHFLLFALDSDEPSPIYVTTEGAKPFTWLQSLPTRGVHGLTIFRSQVVNHDFVAVSQHGSGQSVLFKFNGTKFVTEQILAQQWAHETLHWISWGNEYLLTGGSLRATDGTVKLYKASSDFLSGFDGPNSILVTPDGNHVYIASLNSQSIAGFRRDSNTGALVFTSELSAKSSTGPNGTTSIPNLASFGSFSTKPSVGTYGYPLREAFSMEMSSDGKHLYVAAFFDDSIHTFQRTASTGELLFVNTIRDTSNRFRGPRGLTLSNNDMQVFVVCALSDSIVVFDRDSVTGRLTEKDSVLNGERMITDFPRRLGEGDEYPFIIDLDLGWDDSVNSVEEFEIDGLLYIAVTSTDSAGQNGAMVLLMWNELTQGYEPKQKISGSGSRVDTEFFEIQALTGQKYSYLAVANLDGATTVYVWDPALTKFVMHHTLPVPALPYNSSGCGCSCNSIGCDVCLNDRTTSIPGGINFQDPCSDSTPVCSLQDRALGTYKLKFFRSTQTGESFLMTANHNSLGSETCERAYSLAYRWNEDAPRNFGDLYVWGHGFEPFQAFDTFGAVDVDAAQVTVDGVGMIDIVSFSDFADGDSYQSYIWQYVPSKYNSMLNSRAGGFEVLQSVATTGAFCLRFLQFPGQQSDLFLGVCNRQLGRFTNDVAVYDQLSYLMKWNSSSSRFFSYQDLQGLSIVDPGSESSDVQSMNITNQTNGSSTQDIPSWNVTTVLAGVTDMHLFKDPLGEIYLLIAQSFCPPRMSPMSCGQTIRQPQSAVLQWDRTTLSFTELLSMTDIDHQRLYGSAVPDANIRVHQAALRLPAGRVQQWYAFSRQDAFFILAASKDKGAIVYKWEFDQVTGLTSGIDIATDSSDSTVFVVSELDQALVVLKVGDIKDDTGKVVTHFDHKQTFTRKNLTLSISADDGLIGISGVDVESTDCEGFVDENGQVLAPGTMCETVLVTGRVPRTEFACGAYPPISTKVDPLEPAAQCRNYFFAVNITETSNENLFISQPEIAAMSDEEGSLKFHIRPSETGTATFQASLIKYTGDLPGSSLPMSGIFESAPQFFTIEVVDRNLPLTFILRDVRVPHFPSPYEVVFATNITADPQDFPFFSWIWKYWELDLPYLNQTGVMRYFESTTSANTFLVEDPIFSFSIDNATGMISGIMSVKSFDHKTGSQNFTIKMRDDSPFDSRAGGSQESDVFIFTLTVVNVNRPPSFSVIPTYYSAAEDVVLHTLPSFVQNLSVGPEWESLQTVSFSVSHVEDLQVLGWDTTNIFSQFDVSSNGDLSFSLVPHFAGYVRVFVLATDSGGTEFNGTNSAAVPFLLDIAPSNDAPVLLHTGSSDYQCTGTPANLAHTLADTFFNPASCVINFTVIGTLVNSNRVIENAFKFYQPPDEAATQTLSAQIEVLSMTAGLALFSSIPYVLEDGTLVIPVARAARGDAELRITIADDSGESATNSSSYTFFVRVDLFEELPPFSLTAYKEVVDGGGLESSPQFARVTSLEQVPLSARELIQYSVKCTTTAPGMFEVSPYIDSVGTLWWSIYTGFSGRALCLVRLQAQAAGIPENDEQYFTMRVWPRPRIQHVQPVVAGIESTTRVKLLGTNFGSFKSRGYNAAEYGNLTVFVSGTGSGEQEDVQWTECSNLQVVGDGELNCDIPPGKGRRDIKVEIIDGANRTGTLLGAFLSVEIWYGGVAEDPHCAAYGVPWPHRQEAITECGTRGVLGFSPARAEGVSVDVARLNVSSTIRSLAVMGETVFVGGGFFAVNGSRYQGVFAWDGQTVESMGLGLDGALSAMSLLSAHDQKLLVCGSFNKAYNTHGSLQTGGIAVWNHAVKQWEALGGVAVHGVVTAIHVREGQVAVGGRFSRVGNIDANNIALYKSASGWESVGEGLVGDVHAVSSTNSVIYAGGRLVKAGAREVQNVAAWDGANWQALQDDECLRIGRGICGVNGVVYALAVVGEDLYVAGNFDAAGGLPASNIAVFHSGTWRSVGSGADGPIISLLVAPTPGSDSGMCLYTAGEFSAVKDGTGNIPAAGLARWCVGSQRQVASDSDQALTEFWEPVALPPGVLSIRTIALHTG